MEEACRNESVTPKHTRLPCDLGSLCDLYDVTFSTFLSGSRSFSEGLWLDRERGSARKVCVRNQSWQGP